MILTNINEILSLDVILGLAGFFVPLFIYLLLTKYRGIWSSLFFLPVIYFAILFALSFEALAPYGEMNMVSQILGGFYVLMEPFNVVIHQTVMALLGLIAPEVELVQTILSAPWFPLVLYFLLWVIFMAIFQKRRKKRRKVRRYEDDF